VKIVHKDMLSTDAHHTLKAEVNVWRRLDHPNIIKVSAFTTPRTRPPPRLACPAI
jgi:hypothetical protein